MNLSEEEKKKGKIKIYLGAAPGVGKTFDMLTEGHYLKSQGVDVVVGFVEPYGREDIINMLSDLEVIPKRKIEYEGKTYEEMDRSAIIKRYPRVALIDELAHTNAPGSKYKKRYQDITEILEAGIDVISTVNIQHKETLNDQIYRMTGVKVEETFPDKILDEADEVVVVDITPEELIRRFESGKIYDPEKIDLALKNIFKKANIEVLRELTLREMADEVDEKIATEKITEESIDILGLQENILAYVTEEHDFRNIIRRAARLAERLNGKFFTLYIQTKDFLSSAEKRNIESSRLLTEELGGKFYTIQGKDIPEEIGKFCKEHKITQIFITQPAQSRWEEIFKGSLTNRILRKVEYVDIHVIDIYKEGLKIIY